MWRHGFLPLLRITVSSQIVTVPYKSFAAALGERGSLPNDTPFLIPCLKGDTFCSKLGQEESTKGLADRQNALRGRLTWVKGDKPYTAQDLATKLGSILKVIHKCKWCRLEGVIMTSF